MVLVPLNVQAYTAHEYGYKLEEILVECDKKGFFLCNKFQGDSRGIFHLPINRQKLKITEEEFKGFIDEKYGNKLTISFFKLTADMKFDLNKKYNILKLLNDIKFMQIMNKDESIIRVDFNSYPSLALVHINGEFKLGILPEQEQKFWKTNDGFNAFLILLKNNILRYHMAEAKLLNLDKETLHENIAQAIAPVLVKVSKEDPPLITKFQIKRSFKEVKDFYMPLDSDEKIYSKIKEIHKL